MAKVYTDIQAKELISGRKIKLDIYTDNEGKVLFVAPSEDDRKKLLTADLLKADDPEKAWQYWSTKKEAKQAEVKQK